MRALKFAVVGLILSCENFGPTSPGGLAFQSNGPLDSGQPIADAGFQTDAGFGADAGFTATPCVVNPPDGGIAFFSPCGPDQYCNAPGCQAGVCTPVLTGTISQARNPQCGCDRVTYWNADVAAAFGASIAFEGVCAATIACGGINAVKCAPQAHCNLQQFSMSECNIADPVGTCWALPPACPPASPNVFSHSCALNICVDDCSLIRQEALWYMDPSCPSFSP